MYELDSMIKEIEELSIIKKYPNFQNHLRKIEDKIHDDSFRITIVGEFSSGKSTFINALIGKDILKHSVEITTAAITQIYNVSSEDERNGKAKINFVNGSELLLDDWKEIEKYTTVQENDETEDEVVCVEIYTSYLAADFPVVVVDTPGLNGTKQKHNELTLKEIEKSHACVYLLSAKGVSQTDIDFIKILLNYHNEFIFVQNFIDLIKVTENETKDAKISKVKVNIDNLLNEYKFHYTVCGVSALKALVGFPAPFIPES